MLGELTPAQLNEQLLFDRVEMDPLDRIAGILKLFAVGMAGGKLDDYEPDETRQTDSQIVSPDQAVAILGSEAPRS